jgi:hypothetical protein
MDYKQMNGIFLPVSKIPVSKMMPGYSAPSGKNHMIVVETPKGPKVTNLCSEDYGLIPNEQIFLPLAETLEKAGLEFEINARHRDYQKFFVDFTFPKKSLNFGTKDKPDMIQPKITAVNSFDLSIKYHISAGIWRMVCSNGMMAPDQESFKSIKRLHTTNFAEISLSETLDLIQEFLGDSNLIMEPFEILKERRVTDMELEELVDDVIEYTKFPKRQREAVLQRIIEERHTLGSLDGWVVYNGFNYQLNHNEEITMAENKKFKLDAELVEAISYS